MSNTHIGHNIKKIRGVKNLNQSQFAELFDLKRASIGAYEEGRAEPKITTVIEIAKYFGISVDDMLQKKLSVNDLSRFDIFKEDLPTQVKHNLKPSGKKATLVSVPLVYNPSKLKAKTDEIDFGSLPQIQLPLSANENYLAVELDDDFMCNPTSQGAKGDVVIAYDAQKFDVKKLQVEKVYVLQLEHSFIYARISSATKSNVVLRGDNPNAYQKEIESSSVRAVWKISHLITKNISNRDLLEERVKGLEVRLTMHEKNKQ